MDPLSMEKAMIKNMADKTGKSIDAWINIVNEQKYLKHNELVNFLKIVNIICIFALIIIIYFYKLIV